jgi:transcriptional regulator
METEVQPMEILEQVADEFKEFAKEAAQQDAHIIHCANELIKAINQSGKTVMNPEVDDGFGNINIYIHQNSQLIVEHLTTYNHGTEYEKKVFEKTEGLLTQEAK